MIARAGSPNPVCVGDITFEAGVGDPALHRSHFAQVSLSVIVRLKMGLAGVESLASRLK